jgi:hypothetical protein
LGRRISRERLCQRRKPDYRSPQQRSNDYEIDDTLSLVPAHTRSRSVAASENANISQGIAANGFFVFALFPTNSSFANFLIGFPVVFFQGGGDFQRGLRSFEVSAYAQDQWHVTRKLTLNY